MTEEEYIQKLKDELHISILCDAVDWIAEEGRLVVFKSKLFVEHYNASPSTIYFYYSPQLISTKLKKLQKLGYVKRLVKNDGWLSDRYPAGYWTVTKEGCLYLQNNLSVSESTKNNARKVQSFIENRETSQKSA